jgi:N-6 DNA Methylase
MSNRVTISQIVDDITQLSAAVEPAEFLYEFLACFGLPKATIARLKGGGLNVAKKDGCTLLKSKVYFDPTTDAPLLAIEAAKTDRKIAANKPRFLIATDFKTLAAFDTKRGDSTAFPIGELHAHYAFFLPLAGMEKSTVHPEAEADVKAAENMARLYDLIRADNPPQTREERHALNVFLTRLLFCYFAEDTGIFPEKSFTAAVESCTQPDGSDLAEFLAQLFLTLNTGPTQRAKTPPHLAGFQYVNGGLFCDTHARASAVPRFSTKSRQKLIELGSKRWQEINPDIFGSMFQGVVDDDKRAELGMHYTSVPNIMKVIKALFLDDLYEDLEKSKGSKPKLEKLLSRLYRLRIFDPACGSGNFLIIAYKELRRLEMAVFSELEKSEKRGIMRLPGIHVSQFYGIELDDFAHEIAILALWLTEHQMNLIFKATFGHAPAALPLKDGAKILCGNALQEDWEKACPKTDGHEIFVLGNPPYLGARNQSNEHKADMKRVAGHINGHNNLDYIACWFLKGAAYIRESHAQFAFVSTNSVCQGEQVALLWPHVLQGGLEISFAHQSFKWTNNAKGNAGVTCAIIGVRPGSNQPKIIFHQGVRRAAKNISPYLVDAGNQFINSRRGALSKLPAISFGSMPNDGGHLTLSGEECDAISASHPAAKEFIRRFVGSQEFIRSEFRWCLWIAEDQASLALSIPLIAQRIQRVKEHREASEREATRKLAAVPHRFAEVRYLETQQIIMPSVSSERRHYIPVGWIRSDTVISNLAFAIYHAEPWVFGVISSQMHMVWVRAVAGRLKTDYRYSSSICYNNFPFPDISAEQKRELDQKAEEVLGTREAYFMKTIAWLYDPETMPAELLAAHRTLDAAVEQCYRSKPFTSDEERLEYLFAEYERMTAAEQADLLTPAPATRAKKRAKS